MVLDQQKAAPQISITIVIPTCDRAEYLKHCLETCVSQRYSKLEILVSNNDSSDNTKEVVESFKDSRIRLIKTSQRLGMASHWEFALDHVDTDYVVFIGDDDALLSFSVDMMVRIIQETGTKAIRWDKPAYHWPDYPVQAVKNMLKIRFGNEVKKKDAYDSLKKLANAEISFGKLPGIYHSCVSVSVLRELKLITENLTFLHSQPDVWVCVMLSALIDSYMNSSIPLSLPGMSGKSNGAKTLFRGDGKKVFNEFNELSTKSDDRLLISPVTTSIDLVVFYLLKAAHPYINKLGKTLQVSEAKYFAKSLYRASTGSEQNWIDVQTHIKEIVSQKGVMRYYYNYIIGLHSFENCGNASVPYGLTNSVLTIDASLFNIFNVNSAAEMCSRLLMGNFQRSKILH